MPAVLKARSFIAASQHAGDDLHAGGFGYDKDAGRRYSDLNNRWWENDPVLATSYSLLALEFASGLTR